MKEQKEGKLTGLRDSGYDGSMATNQEIDTQAGIVEDQILNLADRIALETQRKQEEEHPVVRKEDEKKAKKNELPEKAEGNSRSRSEMPSGVEKKAEAAVLKLVEAFFQFGKGVKLDPQKQVDLIKLLSAFQNGASWTRKPNEILWEIATRWPASGAEMEVNLRVQEVLRQRYRDVVGTGVTDQQIDERIETVQKLAQETLLVTDEKGEELALAEAMKTLEKLCSYGEFGGALAEFVGKYADVREKEKLGRPGWDDEYIRDILQDWEQVLGSCQSEVGWLKKEIIKWSTNTKEVARLQESLAVEEQRIAVAMRVKELLLKEAGREGHDYYAITVDDKEKLTALERDKIKPDYIQDQAVLEAYHESGLLLLRPETSVGNLIACYEQWLLLQEQVFSKTQRRTYVPKTAYTEDQLAVLKYKEAIAAALKKKGVDVNDVGSVLKAKADEAKRVRETVESSFNAAKMEQAENVKVSDAKDEVALANEAKAKMEGKDAALARDENWQMMGMSFKEAAKLGRNREGWTTPKNETLYHKNDEENGDPSFLAKFGDELPEIAVAKRFSAGEFMDEKSGGAKLKEAKFEWQKRAEEYKEESKWADYADVRQMLIHFEELKRPATKQLRELRKKQLEYQEWGVLSTDQLAEMHRRYVGYIAQIRGSQNGREVFREDSDKELLAASYVLMGGNPDEDTRSSDKDFFNDKSRNGQTERERDYTQRVADGFADILRADDELLQVFYPTDQSKKAYFERNFIHYSPDNIEDLAWQIAHTNPSLFGERGEHATYARKLKLDKKGGALQVQTRDVVNMANMTLWLRERMYFHHDQGPDSFFNPYEKVKIDKQQKMYDITISDMFESEAKFFTSRYYEETPEGEKKKPRTFTALSYEWQRELLLVMIARRFRIEINEAREPEDMMKVLAELTKQNILTKDMWGQSFFSWMSGLSAEFMGLESDGKVGAIINTLQLAHFNLANPEGLKEELHVNDLNEVFSWSALQAELRVMATRKAEGTGHEITEKDIFDIERELRPFYDAQGRIIKEREFELFSVQFNLWGEPKINNGVRNLVARLLKNYAGKIHDLDMSSEGGKINSNFSDMIAFSMSYYLGAIEHNDPNARGAQVFQRLRGGYDIKQFDGRGGRGIPYLWGQYRDFWVPAMFSLHTNIKNPNDTTKSVSVVMQDLTRERVILDGYLRTLREQYYGKDGKVTHLEEQLKGLSDSQVDDEKRKMFVKEIVKLKREYDARRWEKREDMARTRKMSGDFQFNYNALNDWWANCARRAFQIDNVLGDVGELEFNKWISDVPGIGPVLDRKTMQKEIVKALITPWRYLLKSYGELDYSMPVWAYDYHQKKYRNMPLIETILGPEIFTTNDFIREKVINVKDALGRNVVGKDGKPLMKRAFVVDTDLVNKKLPELVEQVTAGYLAAQLLDHTQTTDWATSPRYKFAMIENILEALSKIPGNVKWGEAGKEPDEMRHTDMYKHFYNKKVIKWIRKHANLPTWKTNGVEFLHAFFVGELGKPKDEVGLMALFEALGIFVRQATTSGSGRGR